MLIEIDGVGQVEVDEGFEDLSPEEQQQLIQHIAEQAKAGKVSGAVPGDRQMLRAFLGQGLGMGFGDEVEAYTRSWMGEDYDAALQDVRGKLEAYENARPFESAALTMGGAVAPALVAGALTGGTGGAAVLGAAGRGIAGRALTSAATGAAGGAVSGFGSGEGGLENRLESAAIGGTIGGVLGGVAPTAAEAIGRGARRIGDSFGMVSDARGRQLAQRKVIEALNRDDLTLDDAERLLREAQDLGIPDAVLADVGENTRQTGWYSQAVPNESRNRTAELFADRRASQAGQIADAATDMAGVTGNTGLDFVDEMAAQTRAMARDAYEPAYAVTLPTEAFQPFLSGGRDRILRRAYQEAEELASIEGRGPLPPIEEVLGTEGAFRPGIDTKTLHEIKQGLDSLVQKEIDPVTGRAATKQGVALAELTRSFNDRIKELNPAYRTAQETYADRMALRRAYDLGASFDRTPADQLARSIRDMSPGERETLRVGVISKVQAMAVDERDGRNFVEAVFGSPKKRSALRAAFPDQASFDRFEKFIRVQKAKTRTANEVMGGSATAKRQLQAEDGAVDPAMLMQLATGNVGGAMNSGGVQAMRARLAKGISEKTAREMGDMLFAVGPQAQQAMLQSLRERAMLDELARQGLFRRSGTAAGLLGIGSGLLAGEGQL